MAGEVPKREIVAAYARHGAGSVSMVARHYDVRRECEPGIWLGEALSRRSRVRRGHADGSAIDPGSGQRLNRMLSRRSGCPS